MVVIAFCVAHHDELLPTQENSSCEQISNAHVIDSSTIPPEAGSLPFRGTVGKQHQNISYSLLRAAPSAETRSGAIYGRRLQADRGQGEMVHD